jgi:hypothetical protein
MLSLMLGSSAAHSEDWHANQDDDNDRATRAQP